jgi:hypothetical protein
VPRDGLGGIDDVTCLWIDAHAITDAGERTGVGATAVLAATDVDRRLLARGRPLGTDGEKEGVSRPRATG